MKDIAVAITPAEGDMMEATTGENGVAEFPAIDWSKGPVTMTSYAAGSIVWSLTKLDQDLIQRWPSLNPALKFDQLPKTDFVFFTLKKDSQVNDSTLSGAIKGKLAADHIVTLSTAGAHSNVWEGPDDNFLLQIESGVPFKVFTKEWAPPAQTTVSSRGFEGQILRWASQDAPATAKGKPTLDIDLSAATTIAPTKTVSGKIVIPGGDNGALGGNSVARVFYSPLATPATQLGMCTKIDVNADKSAFEYQMEYVTPAGIEPLYTRYLVQRTDGAYSILSRNGAPEDGPTIDGMLDPAAVTTSTQALHDPWAVEGLSADAAVRLAVNDAKEALWFINAPPGTKTVTPPKLPAAAEKLVAGASVGQIIGLADLSSDLPIFLRASASRTFKLTK
jgi:hypothetical protein